MCVVLVPGWSAFRVLENEHRACGAARHAGWSREILGSSARASSVRRRVGAGPPCPASAPVRAARSTVRDLTTPSCVSIVASSCTRSLSARRGFHIWIGSGSGLLWSTFAVTGGLALGERSGFLDEGVGFRVSSRGTYVPGVFAPCG